MESPAVPARLIGAIFVERGLVTQEALDEALAEQARTGQLLGEILVARFGVSRLELASAIAEQWAELERGAEDDAATGGDEASSAAIDDGAEIRVRDVGERRPLGEIFVEQGMITEDELAAALRRQGETGERLGEILVAQGAISRLELASALADQWANLQKLRPPEPSPTNGQSAEFADEAEAVSVELVARVEELASRLSEVDSAPEIESLRIALAEAEARLQAAVDEIETARAEGARRLAELAGEMPPLAAEVEALRQRADQLESTGRQTLEGALDDVRAHSDRLDARVDELALRPHVDPSALDELRARLEQLEGRDDAELRGLVAELAGRLDELAGRPVVDPSILEELQGRFAALEARDDSDLRGGLEVLSRRLDEISSRPEVAPSAVESLEQHVQALAERVREVVERPGIDVAFVDEVRQRLAELEGRDHSDLRGGLVALSRQVDEIASRPEPDTAAIDSLRAELWAIVAEVRARLEALEGRDDTELRGRTDELARRLEELAARPAPDLAALEGLHARLDELWDRLEQLAARSSGNVSGLDHVWGRLEQLEGRPVVDAAYIEELASRVSAVETRDDDELRSRVEELARQIGEVADTLQAVEQEDGSGLEARVDALAGQLGELAGRRDEDLIAWVESLQHRVGSLEDRPTADDPTPRIAELEGVVLRRLDDLERHVGHLRERVDDDEASAALWRAVDGLKGQAGQALSLLGQLGAQLEDLESRLHAAERDEPEVPAAASPASAPLPTPERDQAIGHVLFVHAADGYGIVPGDGPVPGAGSRVELEAGEEAVVVRVGRSPLPGDGRPCAYVERAVDV